MLNFYIIIIIIIIMCSDQGRSLQTQEPKLQSVERQVFHCKLRSQGCGLQGINRCGSFSLLSATHSLSLSLSLSLFSIWTDLRRSEDPRGSSVEVRRVNLANWALQTSPKFTTGVKYQFHQGFRPDLRSGNPNHPSPPIILHNKIN